MENEAQAYLMFTDGAEFFTPEMVGMSQARLAQLRNGFLPDHAGGVAARQPRPDTGP